MSILRSPYLKARKLFHLYYVAFKEHAQVCQPWTIHVSFSIRPNSPPGAMSCQILHQSQICSGNLFCFADKITNCKFFSSCLCVFFVCMVHSLRSFLSLLEVSSDRFQIRLQEHRFPSRKHIKFSKTSSIKAMEPATEFKLEKPVVVIDNYDSFTYNLCQVQTSCFLIICICH